LATGGRAEGSLEGLSPPLLKERGYKIAPHFFVSQNILHGPFWGHKRKYSIKKLVEG